MLASVGCTYTLVGHSERRKIFNEVDGDLNHIVEKVLNSHLLTNLITYLLTHSLIQVQESGIIPILCVGESKEEYELGLNEEICTLQLSKDMKGLKPETVRYSSFTQLLAQPITHSLTHSLY